MVRRMRAAKEERGQGVVELAVAMPLLLMILLGTIDMGRVFFDYIEMRQAAVEGAIHGSRKPTDRAGIEAVMRAHGMPSDAAIAIEPDPQCTTTLGAGDITVTASREWTPIALGALNHISGDGSWSFTINASSTMRCLT